VDSLTYRTYVSVIDGTVAVLAGPDRVSSSRFDGFVSGGRMNSRERELPPILRIKRVQQIPGELGLNGVPLGRPVVVLVGGAGGMDENGILALDGVLRHAILPIVDDSAAAIVDGGTDSGVMRAVGRAREGIGGSFPSWVSQRTGPSFFPAE
jgi:hypothetical protein